MKHLEGMEMPKFKSKLQKAEFLAHVYCKMYEMIKAEWEANQKQFEQNLQWYHDELEDLTAMSGQIQEVMADQGNLPKNYLNRVEMSLRMAHTFRQN